MRSGTLIFMSNPPLPPTREPYSLIRVSELGDWVYCNLAWKLRIQGVQPAVESEPKIEAGRQWHVAHGRTAARSIKARRVRNWCIAIALGLAAFLVTLWRAGV